MYVVCQTVVRSVAGPTLVNGDLVSVAALRHRDILSIGGRSLRWEYSVARPRPLAPQPGMYLAIMSCIISLL